MNQPKVSIIIPVYNTAPYLHEALRSIIHQTLKDIEILVINDGSTDGSGEIIRELVATDERIRVFEQENKGLSEARNAGWRNVTGKYLYFMDSDDYLESDCLECCYARCEAQGLDFVFFDAENRVENGVNGNLQDYVRKGRIDEHNVYDGISLIPVLIDNYLFRPPVWLLFANTDFVKSFFGGFYPGIIHEDHLYTFPLHLFAKRIGYIPRTFFKRRVRSGSIMNKRMSMRNIDGYVVTALGLSELAQREQGFARLISQYLYQMLNAVVWQARQMSFKDKIRLWVCFFANGLTQYVSFRNKVIFWLNK